MHREGEAGQPAMSTSGYNNNPQLDVVPLALENVEPRRQGDVEGVEPAELEAGQKNHSGLLCLH